MTQARICWLMLLWGCWLSDGAAASVSVLGRLDRDFVIEPGQTIEGEVWLQNTSHRPVMVSVDIKDYVQSVDAEHWPPAPSHPRSLAPHLTVLPQQQWVEPQSKARVGFRMHLPIDADGSPWAGAYWAGLMIQTEADDEVPTATSNTQWRVRERFQTAVRITATVAAAQAKTELAFVSPQWTPPSVAAHQTSAQAMLAVALTNTGAHLLELDIEGQWLGGQGQMSDEIALGRVRIYPGGARRIRWALDAIDFQPSQALLIATPTDNMWAKQRFGARYVLDAALFD